MDIGHENTFVEWPLEEVLMFNVNLGVICESKSSGDFESEMARKSGHNISALASFLHEPEALLTWIS